MPGADPKRVRVAAVQDAPAFLDPIATLERMLARVDEAADRDIELLAWPETFLPGYPFWLSTTGGARFDDTDQKAAYAQYLNAAIRAEGPELRALVERSAQRGVALVVGFVERGSGPASGSMWCSAATIDPRRGLLGIHRKLMPTWEERLVWAIGDGAGLRVHRLELPRAGVVPISVLNCWENWMPQARCALWAQAPAIHVALWPGSARLTRDITRFAALEGRCFVISASGRLARDDLGDFVLRDHAGEGPYQTGGSAIAGPRGEWLLEPSEGRGLLHADLDLREVDRERHNLDVAGHYGRADVFQFTIDRRRPRLASFVDDHETLPEGEPA
jgi:nitrilase